MALANPLETFVWGAGGARKTPDQIAREREIAEALMAQGYDTSPVGHWAEGLARMANVASGKIREGRANRAEQENATASQQRIASMLGGMGGSASAFPAAPAPAGGATSYAAPDAASARVASAHGDPAIRDGIIQTAEALGLDPVELATAISYETAGTFDPTKAGPTTQWGQHRGFIQFGEPQAQEHGVNWNDPVASQLGPNGAVASYLRKAGVQPGMGLLDIYSAINAGAPGLYNRSDANNGGAPGTVRDKVEQQMAGHRQKALSLIGDYSPASAVAATEAMASGGNNWTAQQASLLANSPADPASWPAREAEIAAQNSPQWVNDLVSAEYGTEPTALAPIETQATEPMAAPMLPEPQSVQDRPVAPVERVAQAMFPMEEMAGMNPRALPSPSGGINPAVMEALSNPYASAQERQIAGVMLQQQMSQQHAEQERMRAQQEAQIEMQRRQQMATELGLDPRYANDEMVYEQAIQREFRDQPTDIREYEYARQQGYPGTFAEFQAEQRRAGATNITNNVGEGSKFYDELDKSQAGTFGALSETGVQARSKMAQIDRLEGLLTQAETGGLAMIKQAAGEYGIATEGLSDIQAAQALINELVPQQRQPGSGPMSDADLALFKQSLPRLINQPGGNQTIINTMRGITQYQIQMGEIADAVADRALTPAQAREQIRNLPNPLASITAAEKNGSNQAVPEGVDPELWQEMTPEERSLWN